MDLLVFGSSIRMYMMVLIINAQDNSLLFDCGGNSNLQIPYMYVNDDYCDCQETGNDEYLTSACNNGKFYCKIDNKYIHSSLVNDGICDCSDGSDEKYNPNIKQCIKYNNKLNHLNYNQNSFNISYIYSNILMNDYMISHYQYKNNKDIHKFYKQNNYKNQFKSSDIDTNKKINKQPQHKTINYDQNTDNINVKQVNEVVSSLFMYYFLYIL